MTASRVEIHFSCTPTHFRGIQGFRMGVGNGLFGMPVLRPCTSGRRLIPRWSLRVGRQQLGALRIGEHP